MPTTFTLLAARELLPAVLRHVDDIVVLRADLADAHAALRRGDAPVGGLPEVKATEARLQEAVDWFADHGIQLKGVAPVIIDFPSQLDGQDVLLCWLEGETALTWYHPAETGFMGRRRLPDAPGDL
jgi:hypothetical protein